MPNCINREQWGNLVVSPFAVFTTFLSCSCRAGGGVCWILLICHLSGILMEALKLESRSSRNNSPILYTTSLSSYYYLQRLLAPCYFWLSCMPCCNCPPGDGLKYHLNLSATNCNTDPGLNHSVLLPKAKNMRRSAKPPSLVETSPFFRSKLTFSISRPTSASAKRAYAVMMVTATLHQASSPHS
jgi:hypothetical protein